MDAQTTQTASGLTQILLEGLLGALFCICGAIAYDLNDRLKIVERRTILTKEDVKAAIKEVLYDDERR